jgi:hypothetical protein
MATIIIKRKNEWANRFRNIHLEINGEYKGAISNNEELKIEVPAGNHTVVAKVDWCGSQPFSIQTSENETIHLLLQGFTFNKYINLGFPIILLLHLLLISIFDFSYTSVLFLPMFLITIYYITFGRNHYLKLSKV